MSYKAEVIADSSGEWVGNALRFPTKEMAEEYGADLAMRWTLVRDWRVVESEDPVMYYGKKGEEIGPELGISTPRKRYMTASEEEAEEKREIDVPLVGNFSPGDKVIVDRKWKQHWTFKGAPAPTKSLWSKLFEQEGVVEGVDNFGNVWIKDRFDQFHGGGGFPVPARFVRKLGTPEMSGR